MKYIIRFVFYCLSVTVFSFLIYNVSAKISIDNNLKTPVVEMLDVPVVFNLDPPDEAFGVPKNVVEAPGRNRPIDKHRYGFMLLNEDFSTFQAMQQAIPNGKIFAVGVEATSTDTEGLREVGNKMPVGGKLLSSQANVETVQ